MLISVSTLFAAQWLIARKTSGDADYAKPSATTCSCHFTTAPDNEGGSYDGKKHLPKLTADGEKIYTNTNGIVFDFIESNCTFHVNLGTVTLDNEKGVDNAGTYHCTITDAVTGQVICSNHEFKIEQTKLEYTGVAVVPNVTGVSTFPIYFGEEAKMSFSWKPATTVYNAAGTAAINGDQVTVIVDATEAGGTASTTATQTITCSNKLYESLINKTPCTTVAQVQNNFYTKYDHDNDATTEDAEPSKSFTIASVATVASGDATNYYTSLNAALTAAGQNPNADLVTVLVLSSTLDNGRAKPAKTITTNIPQKDTLYVAYDNAVTSAYILTTASSTIQCANNIFVGANIQNNGILTIPAVVTGKQIDGDPGTVGGVGSKGTGSSRVYGKYAQINCLNNSKISSNGNSIINCYGYIVGNVDLNGQSEMTTVFSFLDHVGGSAMSPLVLEKKTFPVKRYYIASVQGNIKIGSSATLSGFVNINISSTDYSSKIEFVGKRGGFVALQENGAYVNLSYSNTTGKNSISIHGSADLNAMSLTVSGTTVSTTDNWLPISYLWDIALYPLPNSTSSISAGTGNNIALLPGSTLVINEGVSLQANNLAIYKSCEELNYAIIAGYGYGTFDPASVTVKGTLSAKALGGPIAAASSNAALTFTSNSVSYQEVSSPNKLGSYTLGYNYHTVSLSAEANIVKVDGSTFTSELKSPLANGGYYGFLLSDNVSHAWKAATSGTVYLNANYNNATNQSVSVYFTDDGKLVNALDSLTQPTRSHHKFDAWCNDSGTAFTQDNVQNGSVLYANWKYSPQAKIHYYWNGSWYSTETVFIEDPFLTLSSTSYCTNDTHDFYLDGWTIEGNSYSPGAYADLKTDLGLTIDSSQENAEYILNATRVNKCDVTVTVTVTEPDSSKDYKTPNYTYATAYKDDYKNNNTIHLKPGSLITFTSSGNIVSWTVAVEGGISSTETSVPIMIDGDTSINVTIVPEEDEGCLVEGTLITMADGTQKPVEDLKVGDMVLIFNHVTGQYEAAPIIFNTHSDGEAGYHDVLHLFFSNGEEIKIVASHGFFDLTLMQYVYITYDNYNDYIGHEFYFLNSDGETYSGEAITLTEAYITNEYTRIFCPVSYFHMNSFANGALNTPNIPGDITGLVNYFEYDSDLKYNEEAMARDIEKYGLYSYEDFSDYISYEAYLSSPSVYLKVAVGKGMITYEEIIDVIEYLLSGSLIDADRNQSP